ncbi:hypothetical protein BUALT_Bualt03G0141100 [Buddleja alternifolia]|uniref:Uncharacterized protein n=1 Tax=Buddleja alternifolia TaxID=168488 RepID=A0AAV6Y4G6_9LAMI|nr:hypothetical protein BUALT_Bualt03G0141100 [Buddleja alternifolia]
MNTTFHESLEPFKLLDNDGGEKVGAGELLEESWFFGNRSKTKMSRSFSDLGTTTTTASSKSYEEAYESIKKLTVDDQPGLMKAPSMPPRMERKKDQNYQTAKGMSSDSDPLRSKSNRKTMSSSSSMNLLRAPSLPTSMRMTEDHEFQDDEEIEFSMGKLIRQASLNSSNNLPPRTHASKGLTPSSSLSRHRSRRKAPELESVKTEKINVKPQRLLKQLKPQKSLSDLETEELQGLKDLGFDFDRKDLSPNVINIIPGLQEKKRIEEEEDDQETNRPYLSEAWTAQSSSPPVPKWGGKRSTEDVKAQIKFWARAVASNVRQEC